MDLDVHAPLARQLSTGPAAVAGVTSGRGPGYFDPNRPLFEWSSSQEPELGWATSEDSSTTEATEFNLPNRVQPRPDEDELRRILERLAVLEDQVAVRRLMTQYLHLCDVEKDADKIAGLFLEDGIWEGAGRFREFGINRGQAAVRDMFIDNPKVLPFTAHFLTNEMIVVDGSYARGTWSCFEAATIKSGGQQVWIAGRYVNDFVRAPGGWRFQHLRFDDIFVTPFDVGWLNTSYVRMTG